jgi:ABC-type phosphate/phosphonate transport system substrate-binding protein
MNRRITPQPGRGLSLDQLARYTCVLAAMLVFGWAPRASGQDRREEFYFANLGNTYTGMHVKESRLALQSIIKKIFVRKYPKIRLHLDFLNKGAGLVDVLKSKQYDVIATTGLDYLALRGSIPLQPLVILTKADQPTDTFMLITRKNNTLKALEGLPTRSLVFEAGGGDIARLWLGTFFEDHGLPQYQAFFNVVRSIDKSSRTLLPVFFGQADACVVSGNTLAVMRELNPQIEKQLVVQGRSPGYISILLCATERLEDWARDIVMEETGRMHTIPDGQQALTIMHMKRFFPFKPEYLDATKQIYQRLQKTGGDG